MNQFSCLIRGEKAILVDFDTTWKCDDRAALDEEWEGLPGRLQDLSNRGGGGTVWVKPLLGIEYLELCGWVE